MYLKRNKRLMLVLITLLLSMNAYATDTSSNKISCKDIINSCDKALAAKEEQVKLSNDALRYSMEESKALEEQVKAKESQLNNPIRKPVVLVGAGVVSALLGGPIVAVGVLALVGALF